MRKKRTMIELVSILLISVLFISGCTKTVNDYGQQQTKDTVTVKSEENSSDSLKDSEEYLEQFFDVKFEENVTKEDVNTGIKKVFGEKAPTINKDLNGLTFIKALNQASGFKELSLTYSDKKVKDSLQKAEINKKMDSNSAKYVASSIDTKLLDAATVKELVSVNKITSDIATTSFMEAVNNSGLGRNFLGYSNDSTIYRKIDDSWKSFILYNDKELSPFGAKLVKNNIITGYNLKLNSYNPHFLPEKTITYGHNNINHAIQLIGLLNSENLIAKVQLEPKVSIFKYLPEWGPINESTPMYRVDKVDGLLLANAVEYDLSLEFSSIKDLEKFDQVIDTYAKRNKENKGKGLITTSWWQPFLLTSNDKMPKDRFFEVYEASASNELYSWRTVLLKADKDKMENKLKEVSDFAKTKMEKQYTNLAFFHYLQGKDYE